MGCAVETVQTDNFTSISIQSLARAVIKSTTHSGTNNGNGRQNEEGKGEGA